ncbi:SCO6745 family protein [Streptomyces tendae]
MNAVREVSLTINAAHLFVYFVPEAPEEAARLGVSEDGPAYFALRAAPMGPVPWQITLAAFYNFSPRSVQTMTGVWDTATPQQWQAARFTAVDRAVRRVGVHLTPDRIAEARSLIDPVVECADYAGKTMAAANASVPLPADPLVALWQQITVLREWRGDAHFTVLGAHDIGPCDCNVLQTATGHFPEAIARATRLWNDEEVAAATTRLAARGWLHPDGTATEAGIAARDQIENETDERCAALWTPIGDANVRRLTSLILPIHDAFTEARTYPFHVDTGAAR